MRAVRAAVVAVLAATALPGCSSTSIAGSQPSAAALAEAVVEAIEARDASRLRALAISEAQFRSVVWPELPAARPERNIPADYVWNDLRAKSEAAMHRALADRGGAAADFIDIRFAGGTTQFGSYLVHRETVVTLRRSGAGVEQARLFGSVLEKDGRFKVFSYVVD